MSWNRCRRGIVLLLLSAFVLAGCASHYWPPNELGGNRESTLPNGDLEVCFKTPNHRKWEYAEDLALLQAADLALDHGGGGSSSPATN